MLLEDHVRVVLPNKVVSWLRGEAMQRLVTLKHYKNKTEHYEGLRETLGGWLEVRYSAKGVYRYRRAGDGNVGLEEAGGGPPQPLFFSELAKTLISPEGHLVPNRVVEWLQGKGLSLLVAQTRDPYGVGRAHISHIDDCCVTWTPG